MRRSPLTYGFVLCLFGQSLLFAGAPLRAQSQGSADPKQSLLPTVAAVPSKDSLPAIVPETVATHPLSALPYVFALDRKDPSQLSPEDTAVVAAAAAELSQQAAVAGFDLTNAGWEYRQVVCPALPDYLILDYVHGPDPNGASRFVAALPRSGSGVRIVSSYAHGVRPFDAAWSKSGNYLIFNRMLSRERGSRAVSTAPNWLVIGMCFAELSGHHVQVLTHRQSEDESMDMYRLGATEPQLLIASDGGAEIDFSDVSKPGVTTQWALTFDRHGQLNTVKQLDVRQPAKIALKPAALTPEAPK